MANDLTILMDKILARALLALRSRIMVPMTINSSFSLQASEKGKTIDIPIAGTTTVSDVVPSNTPPAPADSTPLYSQIVLNKWRKSPPFKLTDEDIANINASRDFIPVKMSEAVEALSVDVASDILSKYLGVYGYYGTAGTTPFGAGVAELSAIHARRILFEQKAPRSPRYGMLDGLAEAAALALPAFRDASQRGSADTVTQGDIGQTYGINWGGADAVPTHTAGTISDGAAGRTAAVNNGAGYAIGVKSMNIDKGAAASLTGTVLVGDIFTIAGHSQTYVVVANTSSAQYAAGTGANGGYTAAADAIAALSFEPGLKVAVLDNAVLTVVATHVVNLVYHRDAFGYATRMLDDSLYSTTRILSALSDPETGHIMRLERVDQYKQTMWEVDMLWGSGLVRRELAMRLAG